MAGLKEIKSRIKSVKNTKKITYAMKLVSATKLKKAQEAVELSRDYTKALESLVASLAAEQEDLGAAHPLLSDRDKEENILLIVVGASRGLCGGYNTNVNRAVSKFYEAHAGKNISAICLGRKPSEFFRNQGLSYAQAHEDLKEDPNTWPLDHIMATAEDSFLTGAVDAVYVLYTQFYSALSMEVTTSKMLPLDPSALIHADEQENTAMPGDRIFEPSPAEVFTAVVPRIISSRFRQVCLEAKAGEQGSRMTAMDSATKNASDLIDSLTRTQNRLRQTGITSQILDIIGGAEGLK